MTTNTAAATTQIAITSDEFGTFWYAFTHNGVEHTCFDFSSEKEALSGANFHFKCLVNGWAHEVADGLGAIYRG
jgi:hypothetical protein